MSTLNATGELYRVALNLNFDMLVFPHPSNSRDFQPVCLTSSWSFQGSPNYKTGVYNGTDQEQQEDGAVHGSSFIMRLFTAYFESHVTPWTPSAFTGRSDYGPFLGSVCLCVPILI